MMKIFITLAITAPLLFDANALAFDDGPFVQTGPNDSTPPANLVNPRNGHVAVQTGPNYTNTRDVTVYEPVGPHGVIDTRTGSVILHNELLYNPSKICTSI